VITQEQFKRAKRLEADRDELLKLVKDFSKPTGARMGMCHGYGHNGSLMKSDGAERFDQRNRDLINRINTIVIDELNANINALNLQLGEHVGDPL